MRILTSIVLLLCLAPAALAQDRNSNTGAERGRELPVRSNVFSSVTAQAVLIPAADARRIFGKEIGDRYAVVEVNIGNKSPDAALVIHNIFIDYSLWPLSGTRPDAAGLVAKAETLGGRFGSYQSSSFPSHIASEEYRVVRGQFYNALTWKPRNKFIRLATLAGNIAAAYSFSIGELGFNKGISAFNGVVVPGMSTAWPDTSREQLNLINDLGFRTGHRVPKESAEVVVCFFPIDRFLTPGFRKLFLKSPALFFAPLQMLADRTIEKDVKRALGDDLGLTLEDVNARGSEDVLAALRRQLPCYLRVMKHPVDVAGDPNNRGILNQIYQTGTEACLREFGLKEDVKKTADGLVRTIELDNSMSNAAARVRGFMALDYIASVSLNNVGVTVDGAMSVDTTALAANIDDLQFEQAAANCGPDTQCFWADTAAAGGVRTGTIRGAYLTGGSVTVAETVGLQDFKVLDGATDQRLRFSFKLAQVVPSGTTLNFKVTKPKGKEGGALDSEEFGYTVSYAFGPPQIDETELSGDTLTITGSGFFDNALLVKLRTPGGEVLDDVQLKTKTTKKLTLDIPKDEKEPGCWRAQVFVGDPQRFAPHDGVFAILPTPKVTAASVKAKQVVVTGEQLIDTERCGGKPLGFQLVKKNATDQDTPVGLGLPVSTAADKWVFKLPAAAETGDWTVQPWFGTKKLGDPVELKRP